MLFATLSSSVLLICKLVFDLLRDEGSLGQLLSDVDSTLWALTIIIPTLVAIFFASSIKEKVSLTIYCSLGR
jgi:hypothetical protein